METVILTCEKCNKQIELSILTTRFVCSCGKTSQFIDTSHLEFSRRANICKQCKYRNSKGCLLLPRPCKIRLIWAEEQEPPTNCPKYHELQPSPNF